LGLSNGYVHPRAADLVNPVGPDRAVLRSARAENRLPTQPQVFGNQAMQRFAQSCLLRLPSPSLCHFGGACHTCPAPVQAKLTINKPGDKYKQEAGRVAEQVMRMPEPRLQRQVGPEEEEEETLQAKPLAAQITPLVQRQVELEEEEEEPIQAKFADGAQGQRQEEEPEEEEELIQTKQAGGLTPKVGPSQEARIRSLCGSGRPLPASVCSFFEPRFGYDFGEVRIHTDARAAETTRSLNARAYTVGRDVVFGPGRYAQGTTEGRRLLAHELTHVVQQSASGADVMRRARNAPPVIRRQAGTRRKTNRLARLKRQVVSLKRVGYQTAYPYTNPKTGNLSGFLLQQKFQLTLSKVANAGDYALVQWVKGHLYQKTRKGRVYWLSPLYAHRKEPFLFKHWMIDSPDADVRFGSHRRLRIRVPVTNFEDKPGLIRKKGKRDMPVGLHYEANLRMGVYPWGKPIPTKISDWEKQKPKPFRGVHWGFMWQVKPDKKSLDLKVW